MLHRLRLERRFQEQREHGSDEKRYADAGDTSRPAVAVKELTDVVASLILLGVALVMAAI